MIKRLGTIVLITLIALIAVGYVASEKVGEVVLLKTTDGAGGTHETRLWIAEDEGQLWLRAGMPKNQWFVRIRSNPEVELTRGEETQAMTAVPVETPEARDRVHVLMAQNYGWGDRLIGLMRDPTNSIAVRLDPR